MKTVFTKLTPRATTEASIYMSRQQVEDAWYIPKEYVDRIVIVDFKEEDNDTGTEDTKSR
jgi:hypothetical protein